MEVLRCSRADTQHRATTKCKASTRGTRGVNTRRTRVVRPVSSEHTRVVDVVPRAPARSPAEEAGLRDGDIITQMGNQILDDEHPFINVLYAYSPGEIANLQVMRGNDPLEVTVTFGEHPQP